MKLELRIPTFALLYLLFCCAIARPAFHSDSIFDPDVSLPFHERDSLPTHRTNRDFSSGILKTPILGINDSPRSLSLGAASFPTLAGFANDGGSHQIAFVRWSADGVLDTSFNSDGKFTYDYTVQDDFVHGAYYCGSSICFVGRGGADNVRWFAGKVDPNGSLDTSFYTIGIRTGSFDNNDEILRAITPDGTGTNRQFLGAGYAWRYGRYHFVIAPFTSSGSLDTTFNTVGFALTTMSAFDSGALAVYIDTVIGSGARYMPVLAGPVYNGANWDFGFARYTSSGALDTSFSTDGLVTQPVLSANDKPYTVISTAALIVAGGYAFNGTNNDFALIRLATSGLLDTAFNTSGKVTHSIFNGDDVIFSIMGDGSNVVAVGSADNGGNVDIAIVRYKSNGVLDTSFHTDGKNTFDVLGANDFGISTIIATAGLNYFVGARSVVGGNNQFSLLKLEKDGNLAQSGGPSTSFGTNGVILQDIAGGSDSGVSLLLTTAGPNWLTFVLGQTGNDIGILRYSHINNALDTGFHTDGIQAFDFGGVETLRGGFRFYTGSSFLFSYGDDGADFLIAYYNINPDHQGSTGSLNTAFHTDGKMIIDFSGSDQAYSSYRISDGTLFLVGKDGGTPSKIAIAAFSGVTGNFNTSFATDGTGTFSVNGNSITAKSIHGNNGTQRMFVAADDGQDLVGVAVVDSGSGLSTAFNTVGYRVIDFGGTEFIGGGVLLNSFLTIQRFYMTGGNGDFCIATMNSGGSLDTSFDTDGKATVDFGGSENAKRVVTFGGKIILAGDDGTNFLLVRFNYDGSLDTTFNTSGKRAYPMTGNSTLNDLGVRSDGSICMTGATNTNADLGILCVNP